MNPLRKRFFGDTEIAQRYTGEATDLLEAVHRQRGDLEVYQMHRVLGNGVELFAATRFGQDEIRIVYQPKPKRIGEGAREYCVWEGDNETFTAAIECLGVNGSASFAQCYGPFAGAGSHVHIGSTKSGGQVLRDGDNQPYVTPRVTFDYRFNVDDLTQEIDRYPIDASCTVSSFSSVSPLGDNTKFTMFHLSDAGFSSASDTTFDGLVASASGNPVYYIGPSYNRRVYLTYAVGPTQMTVTDNTGAFLSVTTTSQNTFNRVSITRTGDVLVAEQPAFGSGIVDLHRYAMPGNGRAGSEVYTLPQFLDGRNVISYVAKNDGKTIWVATIGFDDTGYSAVPIKVYKLSNGSIEEITVPGGFPLVEFCQRDNVNNSVNIAHDPITDAIAVVFINEDSPGAWIFDGKDCFGNPMGIFFHKFKSTGIDFSLTIDDGLFYTENQANVTQFFNGRIYVQYRSFLDFISDNDNSYYKFAVTGASYKIGRLLQKKQVSVE